MNDGDPKVNLHKGRSREGLLAQEVRKAPWQEHLLEGHTDRSSKSQAELSQQKEELYVSEAD